MHTGLSGFERASYRRMEGLDFIMTPPLGFPDFAGFGADILVR